MTEPSSQARGAAARVDRTGLTLIHEGELILPAPGSEAELSPTEPEPVEFVFPVEVEIREITSASDGLVAEVLQRLTRALG
jgi:hypothetical protein